MSTVPTIPEYIRLAGSEDVEKAAHEMTEAASEIERAIVTLGQTLFHALNRFEGLVERLERLEANEGGESK